MTQTQTREQAQESEPYKSRLARLEAMLTDLRDTPGSTGDPLVLAALAVELSAELVDHVERDKKLIESYEKSIVAMNKDAEILAEAQSVLNDENIRIKRDSVWVLEQNRAKSHLMKSAHDMLDGVIREYATTKTWDWQRIHSARRALRSTYTLDHYFYPLYRVYSQNELFNHVISTLVVSTILEYVQTHWPAGVSALGVVRVGNLLKKACVHTIIEVTKEANKKWKES